ncbi:MAG: beta-lactamase family protein [Candidatus Delongbacteria bacterium]|nr:beta-lactamase family protein [Candidatus Delongbacteria bacterium]
MLDNKNVIQKPPVNQKFELEIDSLFSDYKKTPGCAVGVYSKGEILFSKGYGIANLDYDIEISPKTVFDIGSVSKQFTAACIVLLESEGKLALDDIIQKHLPEIPKYAEGDITIRHLLHHTSGLRDYLTLMWLSGKDFNDVFKENYALDILKKQKSLNFKPGAEHLYSNSGYLLLAIIIRRVSGESIGEFAHKRIFKPLGMTNTFIYEDSAKVVKNRAIGYEKKGDEFLREHHFDFAVGGDGQVYSTIEDFFRWNENFKSNKLGNNKFLEKMLTKGVLNNGDLLNYALGLVHGEYNNLYTICHGGSWGGFRSFYLQFPDEDLSIIIMSNYAHMNTGHIANQVADIFIKDKLKREEKFEKKLKSSPIKGIELSAKQLQKYCAFYWNKEEEYSRKIYLKNDTLFYYRSDSSESPLFPIAKDEFKMAEVDDDLRVKFTVNDAGQQMMTLIINSGTPSEFTAYTPSSYTDIELKRFAGAYFSEELNVSYLFKLIDNKLMLSPVGHEISPMIPIMENTFANDDFGVFVFKRNSKGEITECELKAGRVSNIKFTKQ